MLKKKVQHSLTGTDIEYKGKLYFACVGYPTSRLLQIDPKTKATKVVMQKTAEN